MPPSRFWFVCLKHFIIGFGGAFTSQLTQSGGTVTDITAVTWVVCVVAGAVAAAVGGSDAWPKEPHP